MTAALLPFLLLGGVGLLAVVPTFALGPLAGPLVVVGLALLVASVVVWRKD